VDFPDTWLGICFFIGYILYVQIDDVSKKEENGRGVIEKRKYKKENKYEAKRR